MKEILAERHELVLEKDGVISQQPYSKLILAVGANPIRLAIAGDGSDDIHVVNSLIDYRSFRENLAQRKDKRVVILGAGLIGCEFANDLLHSEYDVTVIDLAPQPLGRLLPSHIASAFQQNLEEAGVKFALGTTVEKSVKSITVKITRLHWQMVRLWLLILCFQRLAYNRIFLLLKVQIFKPAVV